MKSKILGTAAIITVLLTACNTQNPQQADYIMFGDFYGMCGGPSCVDYYKIEGGTLYKDELNEYPGNNPNHQFIAYTNAYNTQILHLGSLVPTGLYSESTTIGMPDAYDQGGFYIEIHKDGNTQHWLIDRDSANVPTYLHTICDTMSSYLTALE